MIKENLIKRVSQILTLLNPIFILRYRDNPEIVMLLPLLTIIIEMIIDCYFVKKDLKTLSKDLPSIIISKNYDAEAFNQICWSINKYCDIPKLQLETFYRGNSHDLKVDRNKPMYTIGNDIISEFKFDNNIIYIETTVNSNFEIVLSCEKMQVLKKFIANSSIEYQNYLKNDNNGDTYKIFLIKKDVYQNAIWKDSSINVIKNKKNVFLSLDNQKIFDTITHFYNSKIIYQKKGIPYKKGILLYGLAGSGKSSTVYAVAYEFNMSIYKLSLIGLNDSDLIKQIELIPPHSIILIEDIDTIK